ncbi:MAG: ubiquitin-like domain-containing protein [Coprococcus sp.]
MKNLIRIVICVMPVMLLCACGDKSMKISIKDGYTTTIVSISNGETVEEILSEAEITVNDKDIVTPSYDTNISEDGSVITIERNCMVEIKNSDGNIVNLEFTGGTVEDALKKAGITIGEYDIINHETGMYLTDGLTIEYIHRIPVKLIVDGKEKQLVTSAKNVSELLSECDIKLGSEDRINMKSDDVLSENDNIVIERVDVKTITEKEEIAYDTKTEYSDSIYQGESSLKQEGVNGEKEITYEITYVDNSEESRKKVNEVVIKEPVDEIILYGTKRKEVQQPVANGPSVISREQVYDCDGSGHGYWIITYSDGSVAYEDF